MRKKAAPRRGAARRPGSGAPDRANGAEHETRQRLIDVAAQLFAEHGFERVTVRQICRAASANVAAVNYHFGDKLGLYTAVVQTAIAAINGRRAALLDSIADRPPHEQLRRFVRAHIERIVSADQASWIHRLMSREMAEPTAALDLIVNDAIRPQFTALSQIVRQLMGPRADDSRVARVVLSIQGQCLIYVPSPVSTRFSGAGRKCTASDIDAIANHIAEFSLAGIRSLR